MIAWMFMYMGTKTNKFGFWRFAITTSIRFMYQNFTIPQSFFYFFSRVWNSFMKTFKYLYIIGFCENKILAYPSIVAHQNLLYLEVSFKLVVFTSGLCVWVIRMGYIWSWLDYLLSPLLWDNLSLGVVELPGEFHALEVFVQEDCKGSDL